MIQGQYRQANDPNFLTKIIKISKETLIFDYLNFFYSVSTIQSISFVSLKVRYIKNISLML